MNKILASMTGKDAAGDMTEAQRGAWYMAQALEFEKSKRDSEVKSKKLAWLVAAGALCLTGITIIVGGVLIYKYVNTPIPPVVLQVSPNGQVAELKHLIEGKITTTEANDIFNLRRYVDYRESFDWETVQDMYNTVLAMSSEGEGGQYSSFNGSGNANAPVNVLKDKFRVIAKAGTISFVGKTALVSFSKTIKPMSGEKPTTEYYVATIAYEYGNVPTTEKERGLNASGFRVTSYRADRDVTKSMAAQADPGDPK